MNQSSLTNNSLSQETQTSISGSPPYTSESPNNSYLVSHGNSNNANSEFIAGISSLCTGAAANQSLIDDSVLSLECKQKLWSLFKQIEFEFEKECKRIYNDNYPIQERNEKLESSDHEETNIAKKISGSHLSQKIKQQYKQSKQSTSRFVSTFRDRGNTGQLSNMSTTGTNVIAGSNTIGYTNQNMSRHSCNLCWRATDHRDGIWEVNTLGRGLVGTACADGVVRLWNAESGHCSLVYLGHSGSVNSVRFKNGFMLTASGDGTAHLVNLPPDKLNEAMSANEPNKLSVTDHSLIGGDDDLNNGEQNPVVSTVQKKQGFLTNDENENIEGPSTTVAVLRNPSFMYQTASFYNSTGAFGSPTSAAGAAGSTSSSSCAPIDVNAAANLQDSAPLSAADFLVTRNQIVTAGWDRIGRIYDVATGAEVSSLTGHDLPLTDVRTSPHADHCLAVTTSRDCTFRLWDFRCASTEVHVQQGHNGHVSSVNFIGNNSEKLVSAGADRYCKLWDLRQNRNPLKEFRTDSPINRLSVHPNGKVVALPLDNRNVKLIEINMGTRVVRFPARSTSQSHSRIVTSVCWTSDGNGKPNFFSVGFDHQLLAWHLQLPSLIG